MTNFSPAVPRAPMTASALPKGSVKRALTSTRGKTALVALAIIALLVVAGLLAMHFTIGCNAAGFQKLWGVMQAKHNISLGTEILVGVGSVVVGVAAVALIYKLSRSSASPCCCFPRYDHGPDPLYAVEDGDDAAPSDGDGAAAAPTSLPLDTGDEDRDADEQRTQTPPMDLGPMVFEDADSAAAALDRPPKRALTDTLDLRPPEIFRKPDPQNGSF